MNDVCLCWGSKGCNFGILEKILVALCVIWYKLGKFGCILNKCTKIIKIKKIEIDPLCIPLTAFQLYAFQLHAFRSLYVPFRNHCEMLGAIFLLF